MHNENKAEQQVISNTSNIETQHRSHQTQNTPMRLRPLAAALVLALNGAAIDALPTLGGITAVGYLLTLPRSANAAPTACTGGPSNVTCSGNQSAGVASGVDFSAPPVTTLNVTNLSTHIIPSGKVGIQFLSNGTDGTDENIGGGSFFGSGPDGGTGAVGGNVTVHFVGGAYKVITSSDGKHGLFARSIGGDGGDGGWATGLTFPIPVPPFFCPACGPAFGGNGGDANNGGSVYVNSNGGITTGGEGAHGILAESRGGSGGDGGWAFSTTYAEGGDGGGGASGGNVTVVNQGVITTTGEKSKGVYAYSVGGKGGAGGRGDGLFGAGGAGEGTGNGGVVAVANYGQIKSEGEGSEAILANSTGGGGGGGGGAGGVFTFGGDGASAGHGGMVTVLNHGRLETQQDNSSAIFAQSLGGGGGNGGGAIAAGPYFSLAIGGDGGPGGRGGAVDVDSHPASAGDIILTKGNNAHGINAQSTGGGGGNGGYAVSVAIGKEVAVAVAVGGKADGGSDGGIVNVNTSSTIQTQGQSAYGVFADSTGGGGGNGGTSVAGAVSTSGASAAISVGGGGGGGGNSAPSVRNAQGDITTYSVTVLNSGKITTGNAVKDQVNIDQLLNISSSQIAALEAYAHTVSNGATSTLTIAELDGLTREELAAISGISDADADNIKMEARSFMQQDARSYGIYARGIGGGGGDGGLSIAGSMSFGPAGAAVALGGSGDVGGNGGSVKVTNAGNITTYGEGSHAIMAHSLGGGGGNGGGSVAGTLVATSGNSLNASVSVGGKGKGGGVGEEVYVVNDGTLTTHNIGSYGIKAVSQGGGGGDGGFSVAGSLSVSPGKSATIGVSVGGAGGPGNEGGDVTVLNRGRIESFEESSHSIFAQSVGGKGGNGGFSVAGTGAFGGDNLNVGVSVGGSGGTGSTGGTVTVTNQKDIVTHEGESYGVFAQSIGGGGGTGGASFAASAIFYEGVKKDAKNVSLNFAFGGNGGSGNEGGAVIVNNTGVIHTQGFNSHGVFAQSIGGGGGQGGSARTMSVIASPCAGLGPATAFGKVNPLKKGKCAGTAAEFNLNMGGTGDKGGDGGSVTVTNTKSITTEGVDSHGIWAQSVGAGGGSGGEAAHGWYGVPLLGLDAPPPWQNISITMGGSAGSSGNGGVVTVDHQAGKISTGGDGSFGIYAQSVGGGGGQGGHGAPGLLGTVGVGGAGGSSGDGGIVTVKLGSASISSEIETSGNDAHGIYAQSVGGGGGLAGNIERGLGPLGLNFGIGVGITKNAGNAGNGEAVTVTSFGNIATKGRSSMGIFAQSVGGGGGLAGEPGTGFAFVGSAGGNGTAGKVTVNHTGNITTGITGRDTALVDQLTGLDGAQVALLQANGINTVSDLSTTPVATLTAINGIDDLAALDMVREAGRFMHQGDNSHGIFAQSGGGQQHNVDILDASGNKVGVLFGTQSRGGDVDVNVDGDITAYGTDANGIYAHSQGGDGNGNIKVTVNGRVQGGSGDSVGVNILDGASNSLTIKKDGTVTTLDGLSGLAILGGLGNETVNNSGTVTGLVDLGTGANAFNNLVGGRLNSGTTINLGAGTTLKNDGTLSPGGLDRVMSTAITGKLVQTASGKYVTDLDFLNAQADRLNVSGTSSLDGTIAINLVNPGYASSGSTPLKILSSAGGIVEKSNLALSAAQSAVVSYALIYPNLNDVDLGYSVDFSPTGLNRNQSSIGNYVNAIQQAGGSPEFAPIAAHLVSIPDIATLGKAYNQLSPEPLLATATTAVYADLRFSDALHSCRVREGEFRFVSEGECSWIRLIGSKLDQDRTDTNLGFDRKTNTLAAGAQKRVNENWSAGFGFSTDESTLRVSDNTRSEGNQYALGVIAKKNAGAAAFTASIDLGYGPYDTTRLVNLTGPVIATSKQNVGLASAHVRWSHDYEQKNVWYLRPMLDVGVTHVYHGAFDEQGAGAANISAKSGRNTLVSLQPGLEFGREFSTAGGTLIRPYGMVGMTHFVSGTTTGITASLQGAPVGTAPFTTESTMDKTYADLTLGVDALSVKGTTLRLSYTGQFSEHAESHSASLKLSMPF